MKIYSNHLSKSDPCLAKQELKLFLQNYIFLDYDDFTFILFWNYFFTFPVTLVEIIVDCLVYIHLCKIIYIEKKITVWFCVVVVYLVFCGCRFRSTLHASFQIPMVSFETLPATTSQKMKFFIKYLFSKCKELHRKRRIHLHFLQKSLVENFIFSTVNKTKTYLQVKMFPNCLL